MEIICVTTDENHYGLRNFLIPSCKFHNLNLKVITYENDYKSHRIKDIALHKYLQNINDDEIILLTDAFDTMFVSGEREILSKYLQINSPIVFSAEIVCYPDHSLASLYPRSNSATHFKYLNSGGFIGQCGSIRDLIEKYYLNQEIDLSKYQWSNQHVWHQIYLKEQNHIKLDHNSEIFYTLCSPLEISYKFSNAINDTVKEELLTLEQKRLHEEMRFQNDRFLSVITGRLPCHLHFNSPTTKAMMKTDFFNVLRPYV